MRFFFVIAHGIRTSFHILFLDRPLVMALCLGFCTNNLPFALALALVLELFWVDALRLGIIIPPSGTFSFLLLYPLCLLFQWYLPSMLPIPLLLCLFFGHAASWLEQWQRHKNAVYDACLQAWVQWAKPDTVKADNAEPKAENSDFSDDVAYPVQSSARRETLLFSEKNPKALSPAQIITHSRWRMLWSAALLYMVCFGILYAFFVWLQKVYIVPSLPTVTWNVLYGMGLLGAILSLRTKRAYTFLGVGLLFMFMWYAL